MTIQVQIVRGDVLAFKADVLALKFAQGLFGVDAAVVGELVRHDVDVVRRLPAVGDTLLVSSGGAIAAEEVLFVGVEPLGVFDYATLRVFSARVLRSLAKARPQITELALTLHGVGFGLDESEAFRAEIAGLLDAAQDGDAPAGLTRISIVERNAGTATRLEALMQEILPGGLIERTRESDSDVRGLDLSGLVANMRGLDLVGRDSRSKPLVFVAMPFADEYDDRFHYGISGAANKAGFLCERADLATFTGDVIDWVKSRIDAASLVVADLTHANPNVYLEVGYAWGRGVRTVLVVEKGETLKFDVRGQRCLMFSSIRHLEELLTAELTALKQTL